MPSDRTAPEYAERRSAAYTASQQTYRNTEKGKARRQRALERARLATAALKDPSVIEDWSEEERTRFLKKAAESKAKIRERVKRFAQTDKGKAMQEKHGEYLRKKRQQQKLPSDKAMEFRDRVGKAGGAVAAESATVVYR